MTKSKKIAFSVLMVLIVLTISGCTPKNGNSDEDVNENQQESNSNSDRPSPTVVVVQRKSTECVIVEETGMPSSFPNDIPIYDEAIFASATCDTNSPTQKYEVRYHIEEDAEKVYEIYFKKLDNFGWGNFYRSDTDVNSYDSYTLLTAEKLDPETEQTRNVTLDIRVKEGTEFTELIIRETY